MRLQSSLPKPAVTSLLLLLSKPWRPELTWETTSFSFGWQILKVESAPAWTELYRTQEEVKAKLFVRSSAEITQSVIPSSLSLLAVIWTGAWDSFSCVQSPQLWWLLVCPLSDSKGSYVTCSRGLRHKKNKQALSSSKHQKNCNFNFGLKVDYFHFIVFVRDVVDYRSVVICCCKSAEMFLFFKTGEHFYL